jgi:hypothetical protein
VNLTGNTGQDIRNEIGTLFVDIGFIVPVVATSKIILTVYLLQLPYSVEPIVVISLLSLSIYLLDRLVITEEDTESATKTRQTTLLNQYRPVFWFIAIGSLLTFFTITVIKLSLMQFVLINIPLVVFSIYYYLKQTLFLDTAGIAVAWASCLLCTAVFFTDTPPNHAAIIPTFFALGSMKVSETELGNIRDMPADATVGNRTLPMVIGVENTKVGIGIGETFSVVLFAYVANSPVFLAILTVYLLMIYRLLNRIDQTVSSRTILGNRLAKILFAFLILLAFF